MHSVDRGVMDVNYRLDPADVAAIVQDRGDAVLSEHGMYNISVVDHLLAPKADDEESDVFDERSRQGTILVRSLRATVTTRRHSSTPTSSPDNNEMH